jgi:hypothetical protein
MMIDTKGILLKKLQILLPSKRKMRNLEATEIMDNMQQQLYMALLLGQSSKTQNCGLTKPTTDKYLSDLAALGIKLDRTPSKTEVSHLLGLFEPPSQHQVAILKHFKIKNRSEITRTQATLLIKTIFSDPANIEKWKHRPPTTKVKQGILFMGGQLCSNMTQIEAQSKLVRYGEENPHRFMEWKHIESLFLSVNNRDSLEQHNARKITWKRFFQIYDALKNSGVEFKSINADKIHRHAKQLASTRQAPNRQMKNLAA